MVLPLLVIWFCKVCCLNWSWRTRVKLNTWLVSFFMYKAIVKLKLVKMNLLDMRIFSTQLMLYLKTCCHSLTTHINGFHLGSDHLCKGTCVNFIKTIYEVLRKHTIDYKASSTYFNCVQSPLSLIKRGNTFKKSPPWHSWTSNCICKYQMYKKNRTSRILSGQVTFFR